MIKLLSVFLFITVFTVISSAQVAISALEYSVYGAVLDSMDQDFRAANDDKRRHYVVLDRLFNSSISIGRTETNTTLRKRIPVKYKYSLVDETKVKALLEKGETEYKKRGTRDMCGEAVWKYFSAEYPDSEGYYQFSNIEFTGNKQYAALEVKGVGGYWNSFTKYSLTKTPTGWKVHPLEGTASIC